MEEFRITILKESTNQLEEIAVKRNPDLSDRQGYNSNFLGSNVPIPQPTERIIKDVAENSAPNGNGSNYLDYQHFSVMFNRSARLPFITAVNVDGRLNALAGHHEERGSDRWYRDERIGDAPEHFQFGDSNYAGSGFHKGHMVRYYDPAWGDDETKKIAIGDTFYYTNCCPQVGGFNTGEWLNLEDYTMARAIFKDHRVTVFSGPILHDLKTYGNLKVPVSYWKILVYKEAESIQAIGFLLSQKLAFEKLAGEMLLQERIVDTRLDQGDIDRLFNKKNLKRYQVKIALIEEKTGIKFDLNDIDVNANREQYFNKMVLSESEKEEARILEIMKYDFKHLKSKAELHNIQFIKDI